MSRLDILRFLVLRSIGNFLILLACFGVGATFGPIFYYELIYKLALLRGVHYHILSSSHLLPQQDNAKITTQVSPNLMNILNGTTEQILIPNDTNFGIVIPKIGANAKIFSNVDINNETEYLDVLYKGVAHAKGTLFPGTNGTIYLFAHSTDNFWNVGRYNAIFYLLKNLTANDQVIIFFQNNRYNYKVNEIKIVDPSDISYIQNAHKPPEKLILQTCWPPGTTLKRLLVIASPIQ